MPVKPKGGLLQHSRDRCSAVQYPDGSTTQHTVDAENQIAITRDPDNGIFSFSYDPNGNIIGKTYPNGEAEQDAYDTLNRVTHFLETSSNGNQNRLTTYSWDKEGNRTEKSSISS